MSSRAGFVLSFCAVGSDSSVVTMPSKTGRVREAPLAQRYKWLDHRNVLLDIRYLRSSRSSSSDMAPPDLKSAFANLDDATANFHHRFLRYGIKESTLDSLKDALLAIARHAVSL